MVDGAFFQLIGEDVAIGNARVVIDGDVNVLPTRRGAIATLIFAVVGTYIILKVVDMTIGLRVTPEDENVGLDLSQHNERAYS